MVKKVGRPKKNKIKSIIRKNVKFYISIINFLLGSSDRLIDENDENNKDAIDFIYQAKREFSDVEYFILKNIDLDLKKELSEFDSDTYLKLRWMIARYILINILKANVIFSDLVIDAGVIGVGNGNHGLQSFLLTYRSIKEFKSNNNENVGKKTGGPKPFHVDYVLLPFIIDILQRKYGKNSKRKAYALIYSDLIKGKLKEIKVNIPSNDAFRKNADKSIDYRKDGIQSQFFITFIRIINFIQSSTLEELFFYFNFFEGISYYEESDMKVENEVKYFPVQLNELKILVDDFLGNPLISTEIKINSYISDNVRRGFFSP